MKSKFLNRRSRKYGKDLPRTVTVNNDPEFNDTIKLMTNAEYRHFVSFALISHVPEEKRSPGLSDKWSVFRDNMVKKYNK